MIKPKMQVEITDYAPKTVIAMLNNMKQDIICVRGNCDTEVDQMVLEFPIMAEYALISNGKRMIFATHGHKMNKDTKKIRVCRKCSTEIK